MKSEAKRSAPASAPSGARPTAAQASTWKSPETLARLTSMVRAVEEQWHMRWRVKVGDADRTRSLAVARILRAARLALLHKDDKMLQQLSAAARQYLDQHGADFLARRTESAVGLRSLMLGWLRKARAPHELAHLFVTVVWDRPSAIRSELARAGVSLRARDDRDLALANVEMAFAKIQRGTDSGGAFARGRRLALAEAMVSGGLTAIGYPAREASTLFGSG